MGKRKHVPLTSYLYLVPSLLIFAVFLFYPFFKTLYLSLFMTNKMGQAKLFVGLQNYTDLLRSASFLNSLKVTLIFVVIVVFGSMVLGLTAAVLCNRAFPGIRAFSTAYALPMAIASSSAAMIFKIMLHPAVGIVNKLLGLDINWLNDPATALYCVAILTAWLNSGINFLYFSAGLGNIDETIYERRERRTAVLQPDAAGTLSDHVLHAGRQHHPGLPVLRTDQAADRGRPERIDQCHRLLDLPRRVF